MMNPMWLMGTRDEKLLREVQRFASSDGESILDSNRRISWSAGMCPATRLMAWAIFQRISGDRFLIPRRFQLGQDEQRSGDPNYPLSWGVVCSDFTGLTKVMPSVGFNITRG